MLAYEVVRLSAVRDEIKEQVFLAVFRKVGQKLLAAFYHRQHRCVEHRVFLLYVAEAYRSRSARHLPIDQGGQANSVHWTRLSRRVEAHHLLHGGEKIERAARQIHHAARLGVPRPFE